MRTISHLHKGTGPSGRALHGRLIADVLAQLEPGVTKLLQSPRRRYIAAATAGQGAPAPAAAVERGHGL